MVFYKFDRTGLQINITDLYLQPLLAEFLIPTRKMTLTGPFV